MPGPWEKYTAPAASPASAAPARKPWERYGSGTAPAAAASADGRNPADGWGAQGEFLNGATFGFLDEIGAAVFTPVELGIQAASGEPLSVGGAYDRALERQRTALDAYRDQNPGTAIAAGAAGGLFTGAGAAPSVLRSGTTLAANAARGAAAGAAGGAAAGFGEGEGLTDRLEGAAVGGGIGLGLGAAAPLAAAGVGAGIRSVGARRAAQETLGPVGIGRRAGDQIERELGRDAMTAGDARARVDALGSDAMLLDAGQNIGEGAEAVAQLPGSGNRMVRERLAARGRAAPERITAAADEALGPARNIAETTDALIARRNADSAPAYAAALGRPIEWNDRLQAFIDDPVVRKGLREGVDIQRLESLARNEPFNPLDFAVTGFDEAGDPVITGIPNMRTLNVAKKGLDNVLEGYRDPVTGRLNLDERGRAIDGVQRAFVSELDAANPDYAAARAAWAGPTRVRDATGLGQDVFNRSVRPDQLRQRLAAMSDDEREAFQIGARDQLAEVMGTARRDAAAARAMFETGWNREKLGLVLGDDERARQFLDTLGTETDFANRANAITGNSASARRLQRAGEYDGQRGAARGVVDPSSGLWGDVKRTGARAVDAFLDGRSARNAEQMRGEFGDAVSRQGAERDALIDAIMNYGERKTQAAATADPYEEVIRAILGGGALATAGGASR